MRTLPISLFAAACLFTAIPAHAQGKPPPGGTGQDQLPQMQMPAVPGPTGIKQIEVTPAPQLDQKLIPGPSLPQDIMKQDVMGQPNADWSVKPEAKKTPAAAPAAATDLSAGAPEPDVPAAALKADFSDLRQSDTAAVDRVIDPLRVQAKDGRIVQLANIAVPDYDPYDPGPVSVKAVAYLKGLLEGKTVRLFVTKDAGSGRVNRLGDTLAQLERDKGGIWVQGALLGEGLAEVLPSRRNTGMAGALLAAEEQARLARRGLWSDDTVKILAPDNAGEALGKLAIVQGDIVGTAVVSNMVYLNFGPDWRTDFTIGISPDVRRALEKSGINPLNLQGKTVRVRGWLESYNGPFITLVDPVWLQIQDDSKQP